MYHARLKKVIHSSPLPDPGVLDLLASPPPKSAPENPELPRAASAAATPDRHGRSIAGGRSRHDRRRRSGNRHCRTGACGRLAADGQGVGPATRLAMEKEGRREGALARRPFHGSQEPAPSPGGTTCGWGAFRARARAWGAATRGSGSRQTTAPDVDGCSLRCAAVSLLVLGGEETRPGVWTTHPSYAIQPHSFFERPPKIKDPKKPSSKRPLPKRLGKVWRPESRSISGVGVSSVA